MRKVFPALPLFAKQTGGEGHDREAFASGEKSDRRRIRGFVEDSRPKSEGKRSDRAPKDRPANSPKKR